MNDSGEEMTASVTSRSSDSLLTRDTGQTHRSQPAAHLILVSTLLERIAFYSISANLVFTLGQDTQLKWSVSNSSMASFMFSGFSYISTLVFAYISDARLGRFKTIIIGFSIYFLGYVCAILITSPQIFKRVCDISGKANDTNTVFQEPCAQWILPTLVVIAIGAGAVQSNMPVFGIEQLEKPRRTSRYFDKHVIAMNIGAVIAKLVISSIHDKDPTQFFFGYIVAACMLLAAAILFIGGRRYYRHITPHDSAVTYCTPVIKNAFQTWRQSKKSGSSRNEMYNNCEPTNGLDTVANPFGSEARESRRPWTFLDFARVTNHGKFSDRIVDDVKSVRTALIVFSLLIPYWLIYDQLNTSFPAQRQHMKNSQDGQSKTLISTSVSFGDAGTIILGLVIFNLSQYKPLQIRHHSFSIKTRFVIGMCFAFITMFTSGVLEVFRQKHCDGNSYVSNLSIVTQLPQNVFMGLSELFVMTASFEFAYFASRRSTHSLFMSLRFCSIGASSFIGWIYMAIFARTATLLDFGCAPIATRPWNFYIYFFVLAFFQLIFIVVFVLSYKKMTVVQSSLEQAEGEEPIEDE